MRGRVFGVLTALVVGFVFGVGRAGTQLVDRARPAAPVTIRDSATLTAAPLVISDSRDGRLFIAGLAGGVLGNALVSVLLTDLDAAKWARLIFLGFLMIALIAVAFTTKDLIAAPFDWIAMTLVGLSLMLALFSAWQLASACDSCGGYGSSMFAAVLALMTAGTLWLVRLTVVAVARDLGSAMSALRNRLRS